MPTKIIVPNEIFTILPELLQQHGYGLTLKGDTAWIFKKPNSPLPEVQKVFGLRETKRLG